MELYYQAKPLKAICMIFRFFLLLFGVLDLALLDQLSKWFARRYFINPHEITPWLSFHYAENTGIAWSIPIPLVLIIILNIVLITTLFFVAFRYLNPKRILTVIVLILIIGGALGNIYDRITHGYVIDFIAVSTWPVFNLADTFICLGIFLGAIFYGIIRRKPDHINSHDHTYTADVELKSASDSTIS